MTVEHVITGAGAPTNPPPSLGAHYIDTTTEDQYLAGGTASAADWKLLARADQLPATARLVPTGGSQGQMLAVGSGGARVWVTPESGGGTGGGGLTKANIAAKVVQGYLGPGAVSFYDLEIGHVGWYPFAALDQLGTLWSQPAAILGNGIARAYAYPASAMAGRYVELVVSTEAETTTETGTPGLVSYGGEIGQTPYMPALLPGDSVFSSIILRASIGYGSALPADIGVNYNFNFMGHNASLYRDAGDSWKIGYTNASGDWIDLPVSNSALWNGIPQSIEARGVQHAEDPQLIDWTLNLIYQDGQQQEVVEALGTVTTLQSGYNDITPSVQLDRPNVSLTVSRGESVSTGAYTWRLQSFFIEAILA